MKLVNFQLGVAIGGKGFLKPGDTVQCGVDGIGVLENTVIRARVE